MTDSLGATSPDTNKSLVSIALATYNGERFLREQLDSLLTQSYSHFELVISDDKSTDATTTILDEYAKKDTRIRWSTNPNPSGYIANFARAIEMCQGDIVFLCDQDDVWYKEKIQEHVNVYQDPNVKWVYNEVQLTNEKGEGVGYLTDTIKEYYGERKFLYTTWGSCILGCATSYRRELLTGIWPADPLSPGHDSWIQLAIYPAKHFYINKVLQDYRQHERNVFGVRESTQDEDAAITGNRAYLKSLIRNNRLSLWKRGFFVAVLVGKYFRSKVKG